MVDDEEFVLGLGKQTLSKFGYTVLTAAGGERALELYHKNRNRIDLVILDLIMPGMSGKDCLEKILHLNSQARILVASGYADIEPMKETIEAGAKNFIAKPYEIKQMLRVVRETLDA
jgi:DNA-binding NtrC family response regulator